MKCQSDYGTETDALLRQADECTEEWWEGDETRKGEEPEMRAAEDDDSALLVEREIRRRGLVEPTEEGSP